MSELDARTLLLSVRRTISKNTLAATICDLAVAALAEQDAEIARLKDELAETQGRAVLHATGAQCERIIASGEADGEQVGTLLRSTDDRRAWERAGSCWQPR